MEELGFEVEEAKKSQTKVGDGERGGRTLFAAHSIKGLVPLSHHHLVMDHGRTCCCGMPSLK